jgi:hypothetical protein
MMTQSENCIIESTEKPSKFSDPNFRILSQRALELYNRHGIKSYARIAHILHISPENVEYLILAGMYKEELTKGE